MKKILLPGLCGVLFWILPEMQLNAQNSLNTRLKIEKCIQNYQDHSSLGNPGSTYIDSATISAFKDLFESNASLYWDLYKTNESQTNYLLPADEYVDSVNLVYNGLKPVISYGKYDITMNPDGKTAIAYLVKINSLPDEAPVQKQKFTRNIITLRILLNVHNDAVLIQNISRDTRLTSIRSLYFEWGYPFLTKISSDFFGQPVSNIDPSVATDYTIGNISGYSLGITTDIRLARQTADGMLINVGLLYTKTSFEINIRNYVYTYRQTFDQGNKAFECTVFDRAPAISERISFNSISLPVKFKLYFHKKSNQSLRLKYYMKAGAQITMLWGTATAEYDLSHKGGGWFIYSDEKNLPDPDKTWFYLDENNERSDSPDFFAERKFSNSTVMNPSNLYITTVLAIGIEAKFNKILIGIEPWLNIGITSFSSLKGNPVYQLYPATEYAGFMQTYNSPRINSFGLNVIIGKIFNRKY